jgi:hypothetical protein
MQGREASDVLHDLLEDRWTSKAQSRFVLPRTKSWRVRKHGVTYRPTKHDQLGAAMSRLAGDEVELDDPAQLLLALRRAGHISHAEAARLHGEYLRAKYE